MDSAQKIGANVVLERDSKVVLQLRDDLFKWGIFGGLVAGGEDPKATVLREISEELTISVEPARLSLLRIFEGDAHVTHLFRYPLRTELEGAVLTEGVRFALFAQGDLEPEEVIPWHMHMLDWYWNGA